VYILLFRVELEENDIRSKSPKELMSLTVTRQSLGTTIHDLSRMEGLFVKGDKASAIHKKSTMLSPPGWFYEKDQKTGQWRVSITEIIDQIGRDIERLASTGLGKPPSKELQLETVHALVESFSFKQLTSQHFIPYQERRSTDG